jgi:hypothetical protein
MLVAYRLAGLSALEGHHARIGVEAPSGPGLAEGPQPCAR